MTRRANQGDNAACTVTPLYKSSRDGVLPGDRSPDSERGER